VVKWFENFKQWSNFALDALTSNPWAGKNNPHPEKDDSTHADRINAEMKHLHMDDGTVRSMVLAYQRGVANTKVNIQSRSGKPHDLDDIIEKLLLEKSHKKHYSLNQQLGRAQSEKNQVRELLLSGGFLKIHHFSTEFKYGHKEELQPLSVIDKSYNNFEAGEYNGIRVNKKTQAITHLRLFYSTDSDKSRWVAYKNMNLVVDHWHDINQFTGVSSLAPAIRGIKYLKAYHVEVMKGAKKRAGTPLVTLDPHFAEYMNRLKKDTSREGKVKYKEAIDQAMLHGDVFSPKVLPLGTEIVELTGPRDDPYTDLYTNNSRANATASGLSTSRVNGEVVSNYTANIISRATDEEGFSSMFEMLVDDVWEDDFTYHVKGFVLKNLLPVDAEHYFNNQDEYHKPSFIRKSKAHADELKNEKALTEAIKVNKTTSWYEGVQSKGKDPEKLLRDKLYKKQLKKKIKKEMKKKKKKSKKAEEKK